MTRSGFTLLEVLISMLIMGIVSALGIPRFSDWMNREKVRTARREVTVLLAGARSVAAQRGCGAVLHLDESGNRVWITACQVQGGAIDTVGMVRNLAERYGVVFTCDADSLQFAPQGLAVGSSWIVMSFSRGGYDLPLEISPVGRAAW